VVVPDDEAGFVRKVAAKHELDLFKPIAFITTITTGSSVGVAELIGWPTQLGAFVARYYYRFDIKLL